MVAASKAKPPQVTGDGLRASLPLHVQEHFHIFEKSCQHVSMSPRFSSPYNHLQMAGSGRVSRTHLKRMEECESIRGLYTIWRDARRFASIPTT